jgi:hypothetical protein
MSLQLKHSGIDIKQNQRCVGNSAYTRIGDHYIDKRDLKAVIRYILTNNDIEDDPVIPEIVNMIKRFGITSGYNEGHTRYYLPEEQSE